MAFCLIGLYWGYLGKLSSELTSTEYGVISDIAYKAARAQDLVVATPQYNQLAKKIYSRFELIPQISFWALTLATPLALQMVFGWRVEKWLLESADGICAGREYDLTGNVSGRCPECGRPIIAAKPHGETDRGRLVALLAVAGMILPVLYLSFSDLDRRRGEGPVFGGIFVGSLTIILGLALLRRGRPGTEGSWRSALQLGLAMILLIGGFIPLILNLNRQWLWLW